MLKTTLSILLALASLPLFAQAEKLDASRPIVVLPFDSTVKGTPGFTDAVRNDVLAYLKDAGLFAAVLTPEEANGKDKDGVLELSAALAEFSGGNMATRAIVGLGSGRAHAGFDFIIKDGAGRMLWQKRIKETASFWSNSASSSSQRQELPEKIAKALVKEIEKARSK